MCGWSRCELGVCMRLGVEGGGIWAMFTLRLFCLVLSVWKFCMLGSRRRLHQIQIHRWTNICKTQLVGGSFWIAARWTLLYFTLSERNQKVTINNRNIKKGSAKYEQYDGCERRNGENGKNEFLSVGPREKDRERGSWERGNIHSVNWSFKYLPLNCTCIYIICQLELHNLLLYCSCSFIILYFRWTTFTCICNRHCSFCRHWTRLTLLQLSWT